MLCRPQGVSRGALRLHDRALRRALSDPELSQGQPGRDAMSADIVMIDDGVTFDGRSAESGPLGGAETAFIGLARGLATRGHRVRAYARGAGRIDDQGVAWAPVEAGTPETADLYIANRGHRLLDLVPRAGRTAFWVHNPARYVVKPRYLLRLWRRGAGVV